MADANSQPNTNPDGGGSPTTTTTTTKPEPKAEPSAVDLKTLSGDQLTQVLENPELFKLPRIAEALEAQKALKKMKAEQEKANEESLTAQKKFEELATQRGTENETLKQQLKDRDINQALTNLLVKESVVDLDGALKLVDRNQITVNDDGEVEGADKAIEALKTAKTYLFTNSGQPTVGSPSNVTPTTPPSSGQYKFKESQITPEFYKANEKEVLDAYNKGLIEQDGPPR